MITYSQYFTSAIDEIVSKFPKARIVTIYPYGTADDLGNIGATLLFISQLRKIQYDRDPLFNNPSNSLSITKTIASTRKAIKDNYAGGQTILIGHSGGGVAAYKSGYILQEADLFNIGAVVAVGSPKWLLKDIGYNNKFSYITGPEKSDPITRAGLWTLPLTIYQGNPGKSIIMHFKPQDDWSDFHKHYFSDLDWGTNDEFNNVEDLINKIHTLSPLPDISA